MANRVNPESLAWAQQTAATITRVTKHATKLVATTAGAGAQPVAVQVADWVGDIRWTVTPRTDLDGVGGLYDQMMADDIQARATHRLPASFYADERRAARTTGMGF